MSWGGEERKARAILTDQQGVHSGDAPNKLVVVDSDAEIIDLLGEGSIEGLVSGIHSFEGAKGYTGFFTGETFVEYTATGTAGNADIEQMKALGFLRSVYWNDTPVVDQNGYYNFSNINVEYTKGLPEGHLADLNSLLPAQETLDLTVERPIGERLYGISIQGGTVPSAQQNAGALATDSRIDAIAKTYTILNKECTKVQLRVRVNQLFEQIRSEDAPRDYEKDKKIPPVGYGDIKAREIRYNIYYQPIFDYFSDEINEERPKSNEWSFAKTEKILGHISQVYIRSTIITPSATYTDQPGFAGWKIKVIRTTPESLTAYLKNASFVDSIVEIYGTKLRYPYSTMVYSKFDAEFFSRIPQRSYDTKLLKVKVPNNYNPLRKTYGRSDAMTKGSGDLYTTTTLIRSGQRIYWQSGAIMKAHADLTIGTHNLGGWPGTVWARTGTPYGNHAYPVENETGATLEGYIGNVTNPDGVGTTERMGTASDSFWDGGFKEIVNWPGADGTSPLEGSPTIIKEWTNNPAWCFYDLVTNPRYGLGDYIDNDFVDKWALYEIAQYCDVLVPDGTGDLEPRFTMNHIIVSRGEAYKVLNDLSSIFRGLIYYANGLVYAVQDSFKKPLYQFNNTNVVEGNFNYASSAKKTRHSVAVIRYIDRTNLYLPSVEYVENEEAIKRYGIRQIETTALGCTSRGQARRFGEWLLASEAQETESVSFSVGQDGTYLKPGDVLQIYDQYRTPLKFAGRTNAVEGLTVAPSDITYTSTWGGTDAPVTGNSIIIDNAVGFDKETVYKFSLLTPTYNYESTGISDLNSDDEIRRTSVQDLYFLGDHTLTLTGFYSSDYHQGGSGIATQIYFHTGLGLDTDGDGIGDTPVGTSNQLDFANYVITGYTNEYVNGSLSEDYSGGCFSGENLVWSAELNNLTDEAYISGHFSNYRVINVSENDDQTTYAVSALAYSTGKYDEVEDRLDFGNVVIDSKPLWPHFLYNNATSGTQDTAEITLGNPNRGDWDPEKGIIPEGPYEKYATVEIRIPQASTKLTKLTDQTTLPTIQYGINNEARYTLPNRMNYKVCVYPQETLGNGFDDPLLELSATLFKAGNPATPVGTILHEVPNSTYTAKYQKYSLFTIDGDPSKSATSDGFAIPSAVENKPVKFFLESLLTQDTNYWFAVFAYNNFTRSSRAIVGLIPASKDKQSDANQTIIDGNTALSSNQIPEGENFDIIEGINITNLTSSNLALVGEEEIPAVSYTSLNQLNSTQPSFVWNTTNELTEGDDRFRDDYGKDLPMAAAQTYRVTIRKYDGRFENTLAFDTNKPSPEIYVELTGIDLPYENAVFDFIHDYNSPHVVSSLFDNPDAKQYDINGNEGASDANTVWFGVETSGIVYKNAPNDFPLRQFDIVIEAHDDFGATSAGNVVHNGTLRHLEGKAVPNKYDLLNGSKDGYDFVPCSLGIPSGIVFSQTDSLPDESRLDDYSFLTQGQAHLRQYPYLATASLYNNGFLDINMQSSKDAAGNTIFTNSQILNSFPDVRGLVYYYSTGDNSIKDNPDPENGHLIFSPNNKAPFFTMEPPNIPGSKNFGAQGNVKFVQTTAAGVPGTTPISYDNAPAPIETLPITYDSETDTYTRHNVTVYRWYHLFDSSTDPANIKISFPKIAASNVQNIHLTIGLFDTLSYLQHFNADDSPKTKLVVAEASAAPPNDQTTTAVPGVVIDRNGTAWSVTTQTTPTILLEQNIKFSTVPYASHDANGKPIYWDDTVYDNDTKKGFKLAQGTPCFLKERSLQTKGQSALAYRAWWDITLDPGEQGLQMDFYHPVLGEEDEDKILPWYRGPHRVDRIQADQPKLTGPFSSYEQFVTQSINKNKYKGISSISFEVTNTLTFNDYVAEEKRSFPTAGFLSIFFENEQDPAKYTVDVEFKSTNAAVSQQQIVQITDDVNEVNQNLNLRDYVPNDSPLAECRLEEKSRRYVKFFVSPLNVGGITNLNNFADEVADGEWFWRIYWNTLPAGTMNGTNGNNWQASPGGVPVPSSQGWYSTVPLNTTHFNWQGSLYTWYSSSTSTPAGEVCNSRFYVYSVLIHRNGKTITGAWPVGGTFIPSFGGQGSNNQDAFQMHVVQVANNQGIGDENSYHYSLTHKMGASADIERVDRSAQQKMVNEFLSTTYGDAQRETFIGSQIKIKGGILETDTFDIVPQ